MSNPPYAEPENHRCPHCGEALPTGEVHGDARHSRAGFATRGKGKDEVVLSMWKCHVKPAPPPKENP